MHAENIKALKALRTLIEKPELKEGSRRTPLGHGEADLNLNGGLQHGMLHEVFAVIGHEAAATGFVAGLAARVAMGKHVVWIRQEFSTFEFGELSPTGLVELGLDPTQMLLLCLANASDCLRAASDALTCAALGAVVLEIPGNPKILDLLASRRLTLAATEKSVTVFLLRFSARPEASTAETRWQVRAATNDETNENWGHPVFMVDLTRNRHGQTGSWKMEWNCDAQCFQTPAKDRVPVVSAPCH